MSCEKGTCNWLTLFIEASLHSQCKYHAIDDRFRISTVIFAPPRKQKPRILATKYLLAKYRTLTKILRIGPQVNQLKKTQPKNSHAGPKLFKFLAIYVIK